MARSFSLDVSKWCEGQKDRMDIIIRKIALDLFRRVILRTPTDTGRARANWLCAIGDVPNNSVLLNDKTGTATISKMAAVVAGAKAGDIIYLVNNVVYIVPLEFGHSKQAPAGMVGITVAEFQAVVDRATQDR
jgi:hypothetical protein